MGKFTHFCRAAVLVGLAAMGSTSAPAADLFAPAVASPAERSAMDARAIQQKFVSIDTNVLAQTIHSASNDTSFDRAARSTALSGNVTIGLFAGKSVNLHRTSVEAAEDGGVIWNGTTDSGESAVLVVDNGTVAGFIENGGHQYTIDPAANGLHVIREMKNAAMPKDKHIRRPAAAREVEAGTAIDRAAATKEITLMVAYTSRARSAMTAGGATVAQIVDRDIAIVNTGFKNSGIPVHMRRVGLKGVTGTYNENASDPNKPLYDLTSTNAANFGALRTYRNTVKADLVALYIRQTPINYCGVAWVNAPTPLSQYGFAVVDAYCSGTVTLAHELGHTMGLNHDRYVEAASSAANYNYGYVSTNGNFRDIMSYSTKCDVTLHRDCPVRTYYSKPSKFINGVAAGIRQGVAGAADASRWLTEKAATVAAFR